MSGNKIPCEALAEAGKNATLARHETTIDNYIYEEAEKKRHCTISDARHVSADKLSA